MWRRRGDPFDRVFTAVEELYFPTPAVFVLGSRARSSRPVCGNGFVTLLRGGHARHQVIGMRSHAVDEAWHRLVCCTARSANILKKAYGRFLHHHPDGGGHVAVDPLGAISRREAMACEWRVAKPGEQCVLWDLDRQVGVDQPWGLVTWHG